MYSNVTRETEQVELPGWILLHHGCLDLTNPVEWLKRKNIRQYGASDKQRIKNLLWVYAKEGMGKDVNWWKKYHPRASRTQFALDDKLLPFPQ